MYIADLHIHSRFSRATSRECDFPHLDLWARKKGIGVIGTGDFTHPAWRQELREFLCPAEEGFYTLKEDCRLPGAPAQAQTPRFVVTGEISTIYKKGGRTRKVHHVLLLPGIEEAERLAQRLEAIGNLHSDGRPILGLDSHDLLEIVLETCPQAVYIPAHIWTPHFSVFGAFSGFQTLEECYGDLAPYVHAVETGLSSDPPMNWRVSALDGLTLVSHSDAHSPQKLGREADLLDTGLSYPQLAEAIQTGEGFAGTLEFFPEEGKYHLDGHRNCRVCLEPAQTLALEGRCPACGKKLTIGVEHRVEELADRPAGFRPEGAKPFESLIPLPELIACTAGVSAGSKKVQEEYFRLLEALGPEFPLLREVPVEEIARVSGPLVAEGIRRMRAGEVLRTPGYDGEYGVISVFTPEERERFSGQTSLFGATAPAKKKGKATLQKKKTGESVAAPAPALGLNQQQQAAVESEAPVLAVTAGPGTGKTRTLIARIAQLLQTGKAKPGEITAVTFTRQAAKELRQRLEEEMGGKKALRGLTVGTFHSVCLELLDKKPLLSDSEAMELLRELLAREGRKDSPAALREQISRWKNGLSCEPDSLYETYCQSLKEQGLRDLDDLLLDALAVDPRRYKRFTHILVDEFQDCNPLQRKLVQHWGRYSRSLFVIGDPDQSIYGFRGADAGCFRWLKQERPEMESISLEENYRSAPGILQAAEAVISCNPGEGRHLHANAPETAPVRLVQLSSPEEEGTWVAREIKRLTGGLDMLEAQSMGMGEEPVRAFSDIAVLCRTHHQLEQLERVLLRQDIPCLISGKGKLLEQAPVRGALAFYRFLLNNRDVHSLEECLQLVWQLPGSVRQRAVRLLLDEGLSPEQWREKASDLGALAPWLEEYEAALPTVSKERPRKLLDAWRERHGNSRAMEQLCQTAALYDSMQELIESLDAGEEADVQRGCGKYTSGAVRLMTLHGAKGLEFPVVFLCGVEKGSLPLERKGEPVEIEEERRLFFVGMTRAREELILTSGGESSVFAGELPEEVHRETPKIRRRQEAVQLSLF